MPPVVPYLSIGNGKEKTTTKEKENRDCGADYRLTIDLLSTRRIVLAQIRDALARFFSVNRSGAVEASSTRFLPLCLARYRAWSAA